MRKHSSSGGNARMFVARDRKIYREFLKGQLMNRVERMRNGLTMRMLGERFNLSTGRVIQIVEREVKLLNQKKRSDKHVTKSARV